jgi:hypothetical protein
MFHNLVTPCTYWKKYQISIAENTKKILGTPQKTKDFVEWKDSHQIEYHWQDKIRTQYLDHYYPVRAYDLGLALRRDHFLPWDTINLVLKHITDNNKFIEVDRLGQTDERKFLLYLYPRFTMNVRGPHCLLSFDYYKELEKIKEMEKGS